MYICLRDFNEQRNKRYHGSHLILTQYYINKGLKVFGEGGQEPVAAELRQLHVRDKSDPKDQVRSLQMNELLIHPI